MIIDRQIHTVHGERGYSLGEVRLVIDWINPKRIQVRASKADWLIAHKCDVFNEWQVAGDECRQLWQPVNGKSMQYDSQLNSQIAAGEIHDAANGLVKRSQVPEPRNRASMQCQSKAGSQASCRGAQSPLIAERVAGN